MASDAASYGGGGWPAALLMRPPSVGCGAVEPRAAAGGYEERLWCEKWAGRRRLGTLIPLMLFLLSGAMSVAASREGPDQSSFL